MGVLTKAAWTEADILWLKANYPGLKQTEDGALEGALSFQMAHINGSHYINPEPKTVDSLKDFRLYICDTYQIRITNDTRIPWPLVHETVGKIAAVAKRKELTDLDMHMYSDERGFCLASLMELAQAFRCGFSLSVFVDEFIVPFLFAQSYFDKHHRWPWGELKHGPPGLLQWLGRIDDYTSDDIRLTYDVLQQHAGKQETGRLLGSRCRSHKPCICNSGIINRHCCPEIRTAITRLRLAINRGIIPT